MKKTLITQAQETNKEIERIKEEYPLFKGWLMVEYQLDYNRAVGSIAIPYDNNEDFDYESIFEVHHEKLYDLLKMLKLDNFGLFISDTTDGEHYHKDTLENTLKEFSKNFDSQYGGASKEWKTQKHTTLEHNKHGDIYQEEHDTLDLALRYAKDMAAHNERVGSTDLIEVVKSGFDFSAYDPIWSSKGQQYE